MALKVDDDMREAASEAISGIVALIQAILDSPEVGELMAKQAMVMRDAYMKVGFTRTEAIQLVAASLGRSK